ncbi:hypothetical protein DEIGR_100637 [Deinococcus grandis]|uniref:Uncharacterized protein n=1 Tax=Deinococcus grandis TaxID=57498 RepID=A0A117DQ63_9DEIO|nr:hypothetical protein [Deinococcus grandis]BBN95907.1 hypothetical protein DEGR_26400 [Deinococcus grandis]GAQ20610.1 hypothetical protein DEIGR_100637 [Deinococcus grandis]
MTRTRRHARHQTLLATLTGACALGILAALMLGPRGQVNLTATALLAAIPLLDAARLTFHYRDSDEYGRHVLLTAAAVALGVTLTALTLTALISAATPHETVPATALVGLAYLGWLTLVVTHAARTRRDARDDT